MENSSVLADQKLNEIYKHFKTLSRYIANKTNVDIYICEDAVQISILKLIKQKNAIVLTEQGEKSISIKNVTNEMNIIRFETYEEMPINKILNTLKKYATQEVISNQNSNYVKKVTDKVNTSDKMDNEGRNDFFVMPSDKTNASDALEFKELKQNINKILEKHATKEAINMFFAYYVKGDKVKEVAENFGVHISVAKNNIFNCRKKILPYLKNM